VNIGEDWTEEREFPTRMLLLNALPTAANNGVVSVAIGSLLFDCASLLHTGQKGFRVVNH
jgi:hypothetical protein